MVKIFEFSSFFFCLLKILIFNVNGKAHSVTDTHPLFVFALPFFGADGGGTHTLRGARFNGLRPPWVFLNAHNKVQVGGCTQCDLYLVQLRSSLLVRFFFFFFWVISFLAHK